MNKRWALAILLLVTTTLLVGTVTYALFQASTGTDNLPITFTMGTVNLQAVAETSFTVSGLSPGGEVQAGSFPVTYTGTLEAWLGLDITVAGDLFAGDTPCLAVVAVSGPELQKLAEYSPGSDQVVAAVENEDSYTVDIFCYMPQSAGPEYVGKSGTVTVLVKAVQASHNTNENHSGPLVWE